VWSYSSFPLELKTFRLTLVERDGEPDSSSVVVPTVRFGSGTRFVGGWPVTTSGETSLSTLRCCGVP
jgi:hypothetical protein